MRIPLFSLIFFPFLLVSALDNCPSNFQCGNDLVGYPLYDTDKSPGECGLVTLSCQHPTPEIFIGGNASTSTFQYKVDRFISNQSAQVSSKKVQDLILSKSCDIVSYFNGPEYDYDPNQGSQDSVIFTVLSANLSFFYCDTSSPNLIHKTQKYFNGNYFSYIKYDNCSGSTIYYLNHTSPSSERIPGNCKVSLLPAIEGKPISKDFFSLLSSNFTLGWELSFNCMICQDDGGRCSPYNGHEFHCLEKLKDSSIKERKDKEKFHLLLVLATAIPGSAVLLLFLLALTIRLSKINRFKAKKDEEVEDFLKDHGSLPPKRYTHSQLKKLTNSFKTKLGQGGFGCVFKGKLSNGHDVAVKLLKEAKGSGEEFINEVAAISRTSHVNIVSLIGYCFEGHKRALVYEYMPNGSLEKFICDKNSEQNKLGWDVLNNIVIGIARGLEYLHRGCNAQILHLDIKPHNILLDEDFCPKISDFGLAKLCPRKESITSLLDPRGTVGYIAPEVFCRNFGRVSHKSDVYSYGMMVLEMVGGRENRNVEAEVGHTSDVYFPNWIYKGLERNENLAGMHSDTFEETSEDLRKMIIVGLWCIQTDPTHRPSMSKVVVMLEGSLEEMKIPPKPNLSFPSRPVSHSSTTSYLSTNYSTQPKGQSEIELEDSLRCDVTVENCVI